MVPDTDDDADAGRADATSIAEEAGIDADTRELLEDNRAYWEELATVHPETDFYDVTGFLDGENTLLPLERRELTIEAGERLCHLQCHFGLDTLSWAREGALVTGLDFSTAAIELARDLAERTGLVDRARFVEADVYEATTALDGPYDVVFTSYGVLYWLPDLERWAETVAALTAPDGRFYIAEIHPFVAPFTEDTTAADPAFGHPYFPTAGHQTWAADGSYADREATLDADRSHGFPHSMGEILTALLEAGLRPAFLHEHPWACYPAMTAMEADEAGRWWLPDLEHDLPFTFSLLARPG